MAKERLWSLYNKIERLRIDGLKTEHVRTILLAIPARHMEQWFACAADETTWRVLTEINDFFEDIHAIRKAMELGHRQVLSFGQTRTPLRADETPAQWSTGSEFDVQILGGAERRSACRYKRDLGFLVKANGAEFRSATRDISLSGVSLNDPLPRWVPHTFNAVLNGHDGETEVLCTRVSDSRLQIVDSKSWNVLRTWILEGSAP